MGPNECRVPKLIADLEGYYEGDKIWLQVNMGQMLRLQWDIYVESSGDASTQPSAISQDIVFPCEVVDIYSSIQGKAPNGLKDELIMMEYEYLYESVIKYISLDATAYQDFIDWLNNARIDDTVDVCVMALPEPRLDFYHSSDYDVI